MIVFVWGWGCICAPLQQRTFRPPVASRAARAAHAPCIRDPTTAPALAHTLYQITSPVSLPVTDKAMSIEVEVDGQSLTAEPDTGADVTVMFSLIFDKNLVRPAV